MSGAASAIQLLREQPRLRVLIIEKSPVFTRRVGEATVEISTYFLTRCLGLTRYLNEHHLVKQGLRFWFANERAENISQCSEIGPKYLTRLPSFLVDRASLDEEVLRRAVELGAVLWRTATVQKVTLHPGGFQSLTVKYQDRVVEVEGRWVMDASGVTALLARQEGWLRPNEAHPTTSVWSRWKGVKDLDSAELARKYPEWSKVCFGVRGLATNHLMGRGWWAWIIALKGGDVSVGVVFDQRLVKWPEGGSLGERLKSFLLEHPAGRELLADAQWIEGDMHWRKNLPYRSTTFAGDGFALVGDAAGFIDPFYSPGMDWITFTSAGAVSLILAQQRGEAMAARVERYNRDFARSYNCWFEALYQDKYEYLNEYDLMRLAFLMDLGFYYYGVASQPFLRGAQALTEPVFSTPPSVPFYYFMRAYNRRFARIAQDRQRRGAGARTNDRHRYMVKSYNFSPTTSLPLVGAILGWGLLELKEGWRTWFRRKPEPIAAAPLPSGILPKHATTT